MTEGLQILLNSVSAIGPILLIALALTSFLSATRVLNAAVGSAVVFSGFAGIWGSHHGGLLGSLVSAVVVSTGIYVTLELLVLRPQRMRLADVEMGSFAATLGVATILTAAAAMITGGLTLSLAPNTMRVNGILRVGGAAIPYISLIQFLCSVVLAVLLGLLLLRSSYGRRFRALSSNRALAAAIGVDVNRMALLSAILGGVLTGLAAFLSLIEIRSLDVTSASDYLLIPFAAVVAGGLGSLRGTVIACCFFGVAETVAITLIGAPGIQDMLVFGLLFLILYIRPQGFQSAAGSG
jgi:branched-chain amino acid transport system permease protein